MSALQSSELGGGSEVSCSTQPNSPAHIASTHNGRDGGPSSAVLSTIGDKTDVDMSEVDTLHTKSNTASFTTRHTSSLPNRPKEEGGSLPTSLRNNEGGKEDPLDNSATKLNTSADELYAPPQALEGSNSSPFVVTSGSQPGSQPFLAQASVAGTGGSSAFLSSTNNSHPLMQQNSSIIVDAIPAYAHYPSGTPPNRGSQIGSPVPTDLAYAAMYGNTNSNPNIGALNGSVGLSTLGGGFVIAGGQGLVAAGSGDFTTSDPYNNPTIHHVPSSFGSQQLQGGTRASGGGGGIGGAPLLNSSGTDAYRSRSHDVLDASPFSSREAFASSTPQFTNSGFMVPSNGNSRNALAHPSQGSNSAFVPNISVSHPSNTNSNFGAVSSSSGLGRNGSLSNNATPPTSQERLVHQGSGNYTAADDEDGFVLVSEKDYEPQANRGKNGNNRSRNNSNVNNTRPPAQYGTGRPPVHTNTPAIVHYLHAQGSNNFQSNSSQSHTVAGAQSGSSNYAFDGSYFGSGSGNYEPPNRRQNANAPTFVPSGRGTVNALSGVPPEAGTSEIFRGAIAGAGGNNQLGNSASMRSEGASATPSVAAVGGSRSRDRVLEAYRAASDAERQQYTLEMLLGHVVQFAVDAEGSRGLQRLLTEAFVSVWNHYEKASIKGKGNTKTSQTKKQSLAELAAHAPRAPSHLQQGIIDTLRDVFKELEQHMIDMVFDAYANYVVQRFIETQAPEFLRPMVTRCKTHPMFELSQNDYGCRVIQNLLEACASDIRIEDNTNAHAMVTETAKTEASIEREAAALVRELNQGDMVYKLILDRNGNHVIQKCLIFYPHECAFIANAIGDHFIELAKNMYGCRVIQCCYEQLKGADVGYEASHAAYQLMLMAQEHCSQLANSQFGNFVVTHALINSPEPGNTSMWSANSRMSSMLRYSAASRMGTVNNSIAMAPQQTTSSSNLQTIPSKYSRNSTALAGDDLTSQLPSTVNMTRASVATTRQSWMTDRGGADSANMFGPPSPNSLANEYIDPCTIRVRIVDALIPDLLELSCSKFASNVAQRIFQFANEEQRERIVAKLVAPNTSNKGEPLVVTMMMDQYANYVIQSILDACNESQRAAALAVVQQHANTIHKSQYGRHIVCKLIPELGSEVGNASTATNASSGNSTRGGNSGRGGGNRGGGGSGGVPYSVNPRSVNNQRGGGGHYNSTNNYNTGRGQGYPPQQQLHYHFDPYAIHPQPYYPPQPGHMGGYDASSVPSQNPIAVGRVVAAGPALQWGQPLMAPDMSHQPTGLTYPSYAQGAPW